MKQYTSEKEILKDANDIQDACNPIAIAGILRSMCSYLTDVKGTDYACKHPAVKAVIGKLCSLSEIDHNIEDCYSELYSLPYE